MRTVFLKENRLQRRVIRVRKTVSGTAAKPRLSVSRSNQNVYAQLIDDMTGRTLCAVSSQQNDVKASAAYGGNRSAATVVGKLLGEKAKALGIETVCFDRRGNRFHGRIKALADAAREAGLKF